MVKTKGNVLAIIPARGGSKGIPRKNIKELAGKPLIAWTIETALTSKSIDRVIVSTDDEEIAAVARRHNADVPFMRPRELAEDDTPTLPVIIHAAEWVEKNEGMEYEYIVILEPTSPLRTSQHITEAMALLRENGTDSVVSIIPVPGHYNPHWQFTLDDKNTLRIFTGEEMKDIIPRRQLLPTTYTRNGAIYAFKKNLLFSGAPSIYGNNVIGYRMEEEYSVDIDTLEDWIRAEEKISIMKKIA